jgi:hypothetical protein
MYYTVKPARRPTPLDCRAARVIAEYFLKTENLMKRFCLMFVTALATALAASSAVHAQGTMADKLQARFAAADTDHDGKLTLAEAQAGMPRVAAHFAQIDADRKGYVTLADIERYVAQRRQPTQQ